MHPHLQPFYQNRIEPICIGHRGAAGISLENTLAGFKTAIDAGVDGVELDVRLSADHVPVVIHNARLGRYTLMQRNLISRKIASDIHQFDLRPTVRSDERQWLGIPSLVDVLSLFATVRPVLINLELKGRRFARIPSLESVFRVVLDSSIRERVIYSSFFPRVLEAVRMLDPEAAIGYLFNARTPASMRNYWIDRLEPDAIHPHARLALASTPDRIRKFGVPVNVWTINDPDEMVKLRDLGVHGIITDFPDRYKQTILKD